MLASIMYHYGLDALAQANGKSPPTTAAPPRLIRCKHSAILCTRTKRKHSSCDNFCSRPGISVPSHEKDGGQLTVLRVLSVAHRRRELTGKTAGRSISVNAVHDEVSDGENKTGGRIQRHLREEDSVRDDNNMSNCLYLQRSIKNGELVEHSGSVVILGDVNPRGHVLADEDVIVLGRLQGHVHAGRAGYVKARIFATAMEPKEIRIWDSALFCPQTDGSNIPRVAIFSPEGHVTIRPAIEEVNGNQIVPHSMRADQTREDIGSQSPAQTPEKGQTNQDGGLQKRKPSHVALVTGVYISIAGIALFGYPKVLFGILFDLEGVTLGWVRVGAILAVVFGVYYIGTAIGDIKGMKGAEAFYLSTVVGRVFLFLSFLWLVITGAVPRPLLLVGAVNLVGALVMLRALLTPPVHNLGKLGRILWV